MKVLNFGSLNIDYVYKVEHFVRAGETLSSTSREQFCGGKGLNQSVAFARAGCETYHAGCIGTEGTFLIDMLAKNDVNTQFIRTRNDIASGHAIIQVSPQGENCILLYGGANQTIEKFSKCSIKLANLYTHALDEEGALKVYQRTLEN